jgi:hypothetical protein
MFKAEKMILTGNGKRSGFEGGKMFEGQPGTSGK